MNNFSHADVVINFSKSLKQFNTLRIDSFGDLCTVKSVEGLVALIKYFKSLSKEYFVIGAGSNLILPSKFTRAVILLDFDRVPLDEKLFNYSIPSSTKLSHLTALAIKYGFKRWEIFSGIPATLGGAIAMNAGTKYGEISELLESVDIVSSDGELRTINLKGDCFEYRNAKFLKTGDIIVFAKFKNLGIDINVGDKIKKYLRERSNSQPLSSNNCGCVFKNSSRISAGKIIDECGLKGKSFGSVSISKKHANFLEVEMGANHKDVISLINFIKKEVKEKTKIELQLEVKVVNP